MLSLAFHQGQEAGGLTYRTYRTSKVIRVKFFVCVRVSESVGHDEQDLGSVKGRC